MKLRKTVLVIDEEPGVCTLVKAILEQRAGVEVVVAETGKQALLLLDGDVDGLITDIAMRREDGRGLIEKARSRKPALPVCCITGQDGECDGLDNIAIVPKPFVPGQLVQALRNMLAPATPAVALAMGSSLR